MARRVLLVSRHDYRTGWRASFHSIADAFRAVGDHVSFVSIGFSPASHFANDRRIPLSARANRWEQAKGIDCYLWKTSFHPAGLRSALLDRLAKPLYRLYARLPSSALDKAAAEADLIVVGSGLPPILIPRLRRLAPDARLVYVASDLLSTIGAPPVVEELLYEAREAITHVVVVARAMAPHLTYLGRPVHYVPHGIDRDAFGGWAPSPYGPGSNIVTVGSMLFDPDAIDDAATAFPSATFHLIGTPAGATFPRNVVEHGTMAFADTVPWLRHASVGIAPYRRGPSAEYLADSSLKLMQYGYLGLPALCPDFAVGAHPLRFGYVPGDRDSIVAALARALDPTVERRSAPRLSWTQVVDRLAAPERFADTVVE